MPRVFISYRKIDTPWTPDLVYQYLAHRFGAGQVFKSGQSIVAGADFADTLIVQAATCEVMLVLIGPGWLGAVDGDGTRKLDHDEDWVRREIATAFHNQRHVVPLLLGDEVMLPSAHDLPADIAQLARCQFVRLYRSSADFGLNKVAERLVELVPELGVAADAADEASQPSATAAPNAAAPGPIDVRGAAGTTTTIIGGAAPLAAATGEHAIAVTAGDGSKVKIVQRARQWVATHWLAAALLAIAVLGGATTLATYQIVDGTHASTTNGTFIYPANVTASGTEPTTSADTFGAAVQQSPSSAQDSTTSESSTPSLSTPGPSTPQFDPPMQFTNDYNATTAITYNFASVDKTSTELVAWGEDGADFIYDTQDLNVSSGATSESVQRFDPLQTAPTWQVTLAGASSDWFGSVGPTPALAPVSGKPAVIALYVVAIPPNGTIPGHPELHAKAIDAASGTVDWDTVIIKGGDNARINVRTAGSDDAVLAISAEVDQQQETLAVSTANGSVLWTAPSLNALMVARGVIVADKLDGSTANDGRDTLVGVSETNPSKVVWSSASYSYGEYREIKILADYGTTALDAGPHLIQPYARTGRSILDAATGKPVSLPMDLDKCFYDHQSTVACADFSSTAAFDATTWKHLWSLPDTAAHRSKLEITAAWHGLVYGTANGTPVALDARSGADKVTTLAVAPKLVRPGFGVLPGGGLNLTPDREYPATQ